MVTRCINSSFHGTEKSSGTRGKNGQSWIGKKALSRLNSRILPLQAKIHVETWTPPLPTLTDFSSNPLQANKIHYYLLSVEIRWCWPDYNISNNPLNSFQKSLIHLRNPIVTNSNPNHNFDLNPNSNANPKSNLISNWQAKWQCKQERNLSRGTQDR